MQVVLKSRWEGVGRFPGFFFLSRESVRFTFLYLVICLYDWRGWIYAGAHTYVFYYNYRLFSMQK